MTIESPPAPAKRHPVAENVRQHWLVEVARRAQLANSEMLSVPSRSSTEEARVKAALRRAGS